MFVTPEAKRAGLLVAVISGGRSKLYQRPTAKLLAALQDFAPAGVVWIVNEHDAGEYERDGLPFAVYPDDWAFEYAKAHWTDIQLPPETAKALGAFPGREWACLEAERRGCWGVMQLDDNIVQISVARGGGAAARYCYRNGGIALHADLLSAVALSTNGRMVGAHLQSAARERPAIARAGFPYSCFVEKVGPGREHWHGPYEDDIIQAFQYGTRADGATAAVVSAVRYMKDSKTTGGLRTIYDHSRSVQLQRMFPESAAIRVMKSRSNGRGEPRVFHKMSAGAIRNQLRVTDPELFAAVKARIEEILVEWHAEDQASAREKVARRVAQAAGA